MSLEINFIKGYKFNSEFINWLFSNLSISGITAVKINGELFCTINLKNSLPMKVIFPMEWVNEFPTRNLDIINTVENLINESLK